MSTVGQPARTIEVILNAGSGKSDKKVDQQRLAAIFRSAGVDARISVGKGSQIARLASRAAAGASATVVAGGGDGTVSTVASALAETGKSLGVLPLGTFNYFARTLKIPLDLEGAARNVVDGKPIACTVGEVNGRLFLINSSLGLYPALLREREKTYRRWGRSELVAHASAILGLARFRSPLNLNLTVDGAPFSCRTPLVFVGANEYQLRSFELPGPGCLSAEHLVLYVVRAATRLALLRLGIRMLLRRLRGEQDLQILCTREVRVESRRRRLRVALDGEVVRMETPLHFRRVADALRVIVPGT